MARDFTSGGSDGLDRALNGIPTAPPFSWSVWFRPDVTSTWKVLLWVGDDSAFNEYFHLTSTNSNTLQFAARDGSAKSAVTANTHTLNAWNHAFCRAQNSTTRGVILNGGTEATNGTASTPANIDTASIGYNSDSTADDYMDGSICEVAIWNAYLSVAEATALNKRWSARSIRPQNLVSYTRLFKDEDTDLISGAVWTPTGTSITTATHAPIIEPWLQQIFVPSAAPAGGGRIMSSLAKDGGLAGRGGIAGQGGGLAG